MKEFELDIRAGESVDRAVYALYLPALKLQYLLEEIDSWNIASSEMQFYIMNEADKNDAIFYISNTEIKFNYSAFCNPFRRLGKKLFIPLNASLNYELTDKEIDTASNWDYSIFMPNKRFFSLDQADLIGLDKLLSVNPEKNSSWNYAKAGNQPTSTIRSISLSTDTDLKKLLSDGNEDIASEPALSENDLKNDNDTTPIRNTTNKMISRFKGMMSNKDGDTAGPRGTHTPIAGHGPGGSWVERFQKWTTNQLNSVSNKLQDKRLKELENLLDELKTNPSAGLKKALPFSSFNQGRGMAKSGSTLSNHSINFNLTGLAGSGGMLDSWDIPWEIQQQLKKEYREIANREMMNNNYRRAAYIFAHLLGDISAAANVLYQGKYYQEAAILYKEKLRDTRKAADCYEKCGDFQAAIEIYENLEEYLKVAELYQQLKNTEEEKVYIEKAALHEIDKGNLLAAADIYENKAQSTDKALALLESGWPAHQQASKCLEVQLYLLGKYGRKNESKSLLDGFKEEQVPSYACVSFARAMLSTVKSYPDTEIKKQAEDLIRINAARRIPKANLNEREKLLEILSKSVSDDKILHRDVMRYKEKQKSRKKKTVPHPSSSCFSTIEKKIPLSKEIHWQQCCNTGACIFVSGFSDRSFHVVQIDWEWNMQENTWEIPAELSKLSKEDLYKSIRISASFNSSMDLLIYDTVNTRYETKTWSQTDELAKMTGGTPHWMVHYVQNITYSEKKLLYFADFSDNSLTLTIQDMLGNITKSVEYTLDFIPNPYAEIRDIAVQRDSIYVAIDEFLICIQQDHVDYIDFNYPIINLMGSAPFARRRLAVALEKGCAMVWTGWDWQNYNYFNTDLENPKIVFTANGSLICHDVERCEIYESSNQKVKLINSYDHIMVLRDICRGRAGSEYFLLSNDHLQLNKLSDEWY